MVSVGAVSVGAGTFSVIAGPCSIESEEQLPRCLGGEAKRRQAAAGRRFPKPRTSPYSFQGLENEGLRLLLAAGKEVGLPVVTKSWGSPS